MGSAQGIRAGRAYVEVGTNDNPLIAGLKAAEARLRAFGASVSSLGKRFLQLGSAATLPFLGAAKVFADAGSELADMSARTGMSVEALSQLGYAAQQTGTDLAGVEAAARKMQKNIAEAALGSDEATAAFEGLGVSVDTLLKLDPDQQFQAVARSLAYISDPTMKAAAAMKVFGKSGTALLPMIDDFDLLTKKARDLGLVISKDDAEAADALGDSIDTLNAALRRTVVAIGSALSPVLTEAADWLNGAAKETRDWIIAHQQLIPLVFKAAAGLAAFGAAVIVVGEAFEGAASVLGPITALIEGLFSPMGIIIALAAAAGVAFVTLTDTGKTAFAGLLDTATKTIRGIGDALMAGDLKLAAKVLWLSLKVEWTKGTADLTTAWAEFSAGVMIIAAELWASLRKGWVDFTGWLQNLFGDLVTRIAKELLTIQGVGPEAYKALEQNRQMERERQAGNAADQKQQIDAEKQRFIDKVAPKANDGAQADLEAAQAELQAALDKAKEARDKAAKEPGKKPQRPKGFDLEGLDAAVKQTQRKVDVAGSFSADALKGLGAGDSVANDQLKEQKKQTTELQRLNDRIRNAALVFQN